MTDSIEDIVDTFHDLPDKSDQLTYLMELGRSLPAMPDELKTNANKIQGCLNQAWLAVNEASSSPTSLYFYADSESFIVKGLIAIVLAIYSGKGAAEFTTVDAAEKFKELGLQREIGMQRKNGVNALIQRIKSLAALHA